MATKLTIQFKGLCCFAREGIHFEKRTAEAWIPQTRRWDQSIQDAETSTNSKKAFPILHKAHACYLLARTKDFHVDTDITPVQVESHLAVPLDGCEVSFRNATDVEPGDGQFKLLDCMPDLRRLAPTTTTIQKNVLADATAVVDLGSARPARIYGAALGKRGQWIAEGWDGDPISLGNVLGYRIDWELVAEEEEELEVVVRGQPGSELRLVSRPAASPTLVVGCLPFLDLGRWLEEAGPDSDSHILADPHFHQFFRLLQLSGKESEVRSGNFPRPFRQADSPVTDVRCKTSPSGDCEEWDPCESKASSVPYGTMSAGTPTCFSAVV